MIDEALRAFLERGCATIVGTASADGVPHAQRGWGCSVVGPTTVRLLLDASDAELRTHLDAGGPIAVTSADVRTLRSVQLKGRVTEVENVPGPADLERCHVHNEELFRDIEETDFFPRLLTERMVPPGYLVAVVEVEELYDQTPGPGAGAQVEAGWT
ncbi:pyridoxamine 5'-phosphate oxidase family protein [Acidimicrobiia bacterium EGI L10123]|uniref:pyridoxamine 5'-phosphate oxidase family protein n=1 Tax=Salinilacustrithrix flava TaxID=2957203 RepID=UPI003D7C1EB7|nr:pyridoxamine 5'-phosphate oxidase family protein [Acidimicrobiia bacterium EGI L10123]